MALVIFKNLPDTTTPINAENLNNNFNELNKANTYSTTEQKVGTWIDGKPIYRKVISFTNSSTTWTKIGTLSNMSKLISIKGVATDNGNNSVDIPNSGTEQVTFYVKSNGDVMKYATSYYSNNGAFVILEYTKTTD